uniref:Uncharacterized protein n=1 Tax=Arundo donax TaxID=35708 RepID=A0A0A9C753_ARUDO
MASISNQLPARCCSPLDRPLVKALLLIATSQPK